MYIFDVIYKLAIILKKKQEKIPLISGIKNWTSILLLHFIGLSLSVKVLKLLTLNDQKLIKFTASIGFLSQTIYYS
jgi:hypothetical protein